MATITTESAALRTRWGGTILALGLVLSLVSFSLILTLGSPAADPAGRAARIVANAGTVQMSGYFGLFGNLAIALGAFFLMTRPVATNRAIPASACWLFVAIGALLYAGLDAFKAAGLVPLASAYAASPGVYAAIDATRALLVGAGMLVMTTGTFFLFFAESDATHSPVPRPLAYLGAVASVLVIVGAVGAIAAIPQLAMLQMAGYLVFLSLLFLGAKVAFPSAAEREAQFSLARA